MGKIDKKWQEKATKELKGDSTESLNWNTLEGIEVKPLYTADDLMELEHLNNLPGFPPFLRGPAKDLGLLGSTRDFLRQQNQISFTEIIYPQVKQGYL